MQKLSYYILFSFFIIAISGQTVEILQSEPSKNVWFNQLANNAFANDVVPLKYTFDINDKIKYQTMDGFGASLTDASCWLFHYKLTAQKRKEVLDNLFSTKGIGLSILRQPLGASDFNWESWSFDDTTNNYDDWQLENFSLWREDAYIRPVLDQALNVSAGRIKLWASPWSPPAWMKTKKHLFGFGGELRKDVYDVYATYFLKYVQEYERRKSPVYAVTVQNEPLYAPQSYPGMFMSAADQVEFIRDHLGPKFKLYGIKTKIVGYDHNYDTPGLDYSKTVLSGTGDYCAGIGFHPYTYISHVTMTTIHGLYPNKDVWLTEAGSGTWIAGGTTTGMFLDQMMHSIRSVRNWAKGVVFWNVALDQNSGPKLANVDTGSTNRGLLTIRSDLTDSVTYETSYYSLGHSSKYLQPGAFRIDSNDFIDDVENVAYLNPDQTIVVVVSNRTPNERTIKIRWNSKSFTHILPGSAAVTFKWSSA